MSNLIFDRAGWDLIMIIALLVAAFLVGQRMPTWLGYGLAAFLYCNVTDRILTQFLSTLLGSEYLFSLLSFSKLIEALGVGIFLWALLSPSRQEA